MNAIELRDLDQARRFLVQGLWLQRVVPPVPDTVKPVLDWALEAAGQGLPLPPLGFLADLGHTAFRLDLESRPGREAALVEGLPHPLLRAYEDYVLGKVFGDWTFERAGDALRRYQGRDRARGLAFVLDRFRERAGFGGVQLSPAVIKALAADPPEQVLAEGRESLARDGLLSPSPEL